MASYASLRLGMVGDKGSMKVLCAKTQLLSEWLWDVLYVMHLQHIIMPYLFIISRYD